MIEDSNMTNNAEEWLDRGQELDDLGKYDEAIKCYVKAIEINPEFGGPWNNKGSVLVDLGKYGEAIKCFDKAIELLQEDGLPWCNKGNALIGVGKYDKAIKCYDKALELSPQYVDAIKGKELCLSSMNVSAS